MVGANKNPDGCAYRKMILEIIEDMEFLATTFNTTYGDETKRSFKQGQKEACMKWAKILRERLKELEERESGQ